MAYTTNSGSTAPRNGANVAVNSMSNSQLATYYFNDTSLGTIANQSPNFSGLRDKLADGRLGSDFTDWQDAVFIRSKLLSQN
jgi:hypothetical protein